MPRFYTIGDLARRFRQSNQKIRRIVDSLGGGVPRAGLYRLVPESMVDEISKRLQSDSKPATDGTAT